MIICKLKHLFSYLHYYVFRVHQMKCKLIRSLYTFMMTSWQVFCSAAFCECPSGNFWDIPVDIDNKIACLDLLYMLSVVRWHVFWIVAVYVKLTWLFFLIIIAIYCPFVFVVSAWKRCQAVRWTCSCSSQMAVRRLYWRRRDVSVSCWTNTACSPIRLLPSMIRYGTDHFACPWLNISQAVVVKSLYPFTKPFEIYSNHQLEHLIPNPLSQESQCIVLP